MYYASFGNSATFSTSVWYLVCRTSLTSRLNAFIKSCIFHKTKSTVNKNQRISSQIIQEIRPLQKSHTENYFMIHMIRCFIIYTYIVYSLLHNNSCSNRSPEQGKSNCRFFLILKVFIHHNVTFCVCTDRHQKDLIILPILNMETHNMFMISRIDEQIIRWQSHIYVT